MGRVIEFLLAALLVSAISVAAVLWFAAGVLIEPFNSGAADARPDAAFAENFLIRTSDGVALNAAFTPPEGERKGCMLLLHGNGGVLGDMGGLAATLTKAGHGAMAIDFRGHGGSDAVDRSAGWVERLDADAAFAEMARRCEGRPLGIYGFSLGGAAALLGEAGRTSDLLILESVYADIDRAVGQRMDDRLGTTFGPVASEALLKMLEWRTGISAADASPAKAAKHISAFTFLIAGGDDYRAPPTDSEAIAAKLAGEHRLYVVPGARHGEAQALGGRDLDQQFATLLAEHLTR